MSNPLSGGVAVFDNQLTLFFTALVMTVLGVVLFSSKGIKGAAWNSVAIVIAGAGAYILITMIPDSWGSLVKPLATAAVGVGASFALIKTDGMVTTVLGIIGAVVSFLAVWGFLPDPAKEYLSALWQEVVRGVSQFARVISNGVGKNAGG